MANQTDTYNAESKFTGVNVDPDNLTIVGLDCPEEDFPELADPDRLKLSVEDLVPSIIEHGIIEPIKIRKRRDDERIFVDVGRRRVRAARKAKERGCKILVPCVPSDKASDPLYNLIAENEARVNDAPLTRIAKAARMKTHGATDATIRNTFGVSQSTLRNWWLLREAVPQVKRAVEDEKITLVAAFEIAKFPANQQGSELLRAIEEGGRGATVLQNVRAARQASKNGGSAADAPRRLPLAGQKRVVAALKDVLGNTDVPAPVEVHAGYALLSAIHGDASPLDAFPTLRHVYDAALNPPKVEEDVVGAQAQ